MRYKQNCTKYLITFFSVLMCFSSSAYAAFVPGDSASNNTTGNAFNIDGFFSTEFNASIESGDSTNDSTTIAHASISDLTADTALNVISFTVAGAGVKGIFDIDKGRFLDSFITLLDTDGSTVLAFNDDSPFAGVDDATNRNSFLTYTFSAPGLYFLEVGAWGNNVGNHPDLWDSNDADFNFTQHISLSTAVPVPAAAWLFSSGLLGLVGVARRKK